MSMCLNWQVSRLSQTRSNKPLQRRPRSAFHSDIAVLHATPLMVALDGYRLLSIPRVRIQMVIRAIVWIAHSNVARAAATPESKLPRADLFPATKTAKRRRVPFALPLNPRCRRIGFVFTAATFTKWRSIVFLSAHSKTPFLARPDFDMPT
jgi:hypothetical protein